MIEEIPLKNLTLLEQNPRKITKDQMAKLCMSIKSDPEFLFKRPVLVNLVEGKHVVYAGNQRVRAALKNKMKTIPCIIEENIPDEVIKRRVILDNKTFGEFDFDILANEFDADMLVDCGFDANELFGFFDDSVDDFKEKDSKKKKGKKIQCPNCGHDFEV